jgi:hypothetical protein
VLKGSPRRGVEDAPALQGRLVSTSRPRLSLIDGDEGERSASR